MLAINTIVIQPPFFFSPHTHQTMCTCTPFESIHVTACDYDQSYRSPVIQRWQQSPIISSMVRILWYYLDQMAAIQSADQLFICHGRKTQGLFFLNRLTDWPTGWWTSPCPISGLPNVGTEKCLPYLQEIVSLNSDHATVFWEWEYKRAKLVMFSVWEGWH